MQTCNFVLTQHCKTSRVFDYSQISPAACRYVEEGKWQYHKVRNAGHWIPRDAPDELNDLLITFLKSTNHSKLWVIIWSNDFRVTLCFNSGAYHTVISTWPNNRRVCWSAVWIFADDCRHIYYCCMLCTCNVQPVRWLLWRCWVTIHITVHIRGTLSSHIRRVLLRKTPLEHERDEVYRHLTRQAFASRLSNGHSRLWAYIICMLSGSNAAEPPNTRIIMVLTYCKY